MRVDKERLFEKVISTGRKALCVNMPDPKKVVDKGAVAIVMVVVSAVTKALKLFYYQNLIERKGWQKDFSEYAMKNHPDFVKNLEGTL